MITPTAKRLDLHFESMQPSNLHYESMTELMTATSLNVILRNTFLLHTIDVNLFVFIIIPLSNEVLHHVLSGRVLAMNHFDDGILSTSSVLSSRVLATNYFDDGILCPTSSLLSGRVSATNHFDDGLLRSTSICHPSIFNLLYYLLYQRLRGGLSDDQITYRPLSDQLLYHPLLELRCVKYHNVRRYHLSYKVVQVIHRSTLEMMLITTSLLMGFFLLWFNSSIILRHYFTNLSVRWGVDDAADAADADANNTDAP